MQEFFETHSYLTQIFGFSALIIGILMYQFKNHRTIMILMTVNCTLWCLHYTSMWLFTPVAMNFLNVVRSYVYSLDKKWERSKFVPVVFILLSAVMTIVTWQGACGLLTLAASVFAVIGGWQKNEQILRLLTIPVCLCWLTFNLINHSWAGMTSDSLVLISVVIAVIRYKLKEKNKFIA